jgi:hypothetical protein
VTAGRRYFDAAGERQLEQAYKGRSTWWCVNDELGAVMLAGPAGPPAGVDSLELRRTVGRNWARTDAYKDKCDTIFAAPLAETSLNPGDVAGDVAAVFYPEWDHAAVAEAARALGNSALDLPPGWRGWVVPGKKGAVPRRHLAVANLGASAGSGQVPLSFAEGAPLLAAAATVRGRSTRLPLELGPFETFGQTIDAYIEVQGPAEVEVRRTSLGRYSLKAAPGQSAKVTLRLAEAAGPLQVVDAQGKVTQDVQGGAGGYTFEVRGEVTVVDRAAAGSDNGGPAVEIGEIIVREDGRASVPVIARDQSGIALVRIFLDGKEIETRDSAPFVWAGWPGKGYHTFQAVAEDNSPARNQRRSDPVTVKIPDPPESEE